MKNDSGVRNAGATIKKKIKITIAATAAPTSGRANNRFDRPSFTRFDASAGAPVGAGVWMSDSCELRSVGIGRGPLTHAN